VCSMSRLFTTILDRFRSDTISKADAPRHPGEADEGAGSLTVIDGAFGGED